MDLLSVINQGRGAMLNAMTWFLTSDIRPSGGFCSGRRLLLYGLYHSALNRNRVAFLVTTESEALAQLARMQPGVLVVTPTLEQGDGLALVEKARSVLSDVRTVVVCDHDSDDIVVVGGSTADAVVCEQELLSEGNPLQKMVISLALGRRYRSPLVQEALERAQGLQGGSMRQGVPPLSAREKDLIDLWVEGLGDREAAERLGISYATVRGYGRSLRTKLGVATRAQAVIKGLAMGLSRVVSR